MNCSNQNMLFLPFDYGSLREQLLIAKSVKEDGFFGVIFLLYRKNLANKIIKREINQLGFSYQDVVSDFDPGLVRRKEVGLSFSYFRVIVDFFVILYKRLYIRICARKFLKKFDIVGLVLSADRHAGWETALVKYANLKNIPSLIIQYAVYTSSGMVEYNYNRSEKNLHPFRASYSFLNKITHKIVPNIAREFQGELVLLTNYITPLANYFSGLMPGNPWLQGGGYARKMCMEGDRVRKFYERQGMIPSKMVVTGKPTSDILFKNYHKYRITKERERNKAVDKIRVLVAVPQMGEHKMLEWEKHMAETDYLFSCLPTDKNVELILCLHPKSKREHYDAFAKEYNAKFSEEGIYEEILYCDIFISIYSSVLTSALALRKKCIVISYVYVYGHELFDHGENIWFVDKKEKLLAMISSVVEEVRIDQGSKKNLPIDADWSLIDGHAVKRITACLYNELKLTI